MLKRRKIETRKQYEKRIRRRQIAMAALCGVEENLPQPQTPQHRYYSTKPQSPVTPYSRHGDAALEIYDRHAAQTILKRRRPRGRSELYRQFEVNLSSSSSSSRTESAHTQSFSVSILSQEESTLIPLQKEVPRRRGQQGDRDDLGTVNTGKKKLVPVQATKSAAISVEKPIAQKASRSVHKPSSKVSKGLDTKTGFFCCNFMWKQAKAISLHSGPGMSLTEEKRLWRIALEGEDGMSRNLATNGKNAQISQIEVIPVDQTFQTAGTINYAEMEGIGMVFAPTLIRKAPTSPANAPLPWWKRDSWNDLSNSDNGPDHQDQSAARTSAYTKKMSNKRTNPLPRVEEKPQLERAFDRMSIEVVEKPAPVKGGSVQSRRPPTPIDLTDREGSSSDGLDGTDSIAKKNRSASAVKKRGNAHSKNSTEKVLVNDVSFSDLDESLDQRILRVSNARKQQVKQEAFQLAKSGLHRPFQTFEAKPAPRQSAANTDGEVDRPIFIPSLNHKYRDLTLDPRLDISRGRANASKQMDNDLVQCENDSRVASESDLSLLVRQIDGHRRPAALPEAARIFERQANEVRPVDSDVSERINRNSSPLLTALLADSGESSGCFATILENEDSSTRREETQEVQIERLDEQATNDSPAAFPKRHAHSLVIHSLLSDPSALALHSLPTPVAMRNPSPRSQTLDVEHSMYSPTFETMSGVLNAKRLSPIFFQGANEDNASERPWRDGSSMIPQQHKASEVISRDNAADGWKHRPQNTGFKQETNARGRRKEKDPFQHVDHTIGRSPRRKRSKSPIRLYGDPPFPVRMDGSPVRLQHSNERAVLGGHSDESSIEAPDKGLGTVAPRPELRELTSSQRNRVDARLPVRPETIIVLDPLSDSPKPSTETSLRSSTPIILCTTEVGSPLSSKRENYVVIDLVDESNKVPQAPLQANHHRNVESAVFSRSQAEQIPAYVTPGKSLYGGQAALDCDDESLTLSPWDSTLEAHADDPSINAELRRLDASEELLRQELNEVQLRRNRLMPPINVETRCIETSSPIDCTLCASRSSIFSSRVRSEMNQPHGAKQHSNGVQIDCNNSFVNEVYDVTDISAGSDHGMAAMACDEISTFSDHGIAAAASDVIDLVRSAAKEPEELGVATGSLPVASAYELKPNPNFSHSLHSPEHAPDSCRLTNDRRGGANDGQIEVAFGQTLASARRVVPATAIDDWLPQPGNAAESSLHKNSSLSNNVRSRQTFSLSCYHDPSGPINHCSPLSYRALESAQKNDTLDDEIEIVFDGQPQTPLSVASRSPRNPMSTTVSPIRNPIPTQDDANPMLSPLSSRRRGDNHTGYSLTDRPRSRSQGAVAEDLVSGIYSRDGTLQSPLHLAGDRFQKLSVSNTPSTLTPTIPRRDVSPRSSFISGRNRCDDGAMISPTSTTKSNPRSPTLNMRRSLSSQRAWNPMDHLPDGSCDISTDDVLAIYMQATSTSELASPDFGLKIESPQSEKHHSYGLAREEPRRDSDGRYLPYVVDAKDAQTSRSFDGSSEAAKYSGVGRGSQNYAWNAAVESIQHNGDSLVDRELSWQSVEQLYQLSPQDTDRANDRRDSHVVMTTTKSNSVFFPYDHDDWEISPDSRVNKALFDRREDFSPSSSRLELQQMYDQYDYLDGKRRIEKSPQSPWHSTHPGSALGEHPAHHRVRLRSSESFESELESLGGNGGNLASPNYDSTSERAFRFTESAVTSAYFSASVEKSEERKDDDSDALESKVVSLALSVETESTSSSDSRIDTHIAKVDLQLDVNRKAGNRTRSQEMDSRRRLQSLKQRYKHLYQKAPEKQAVTTMAADADHKVRFNLNTDENGNLQALQRGVLPKAGLHRKQRVGRLKKLQSRMHPFVNERPQHHALERQPRSHSVGGRKGSSFITDLGIPQVFAEHYMEGPKRRAATNKDANSGMLVEVFMPIIGAPLDGKIKELKKNADHATRDHSIASSTTRSRELVHALPSSAKTRNVAAAKPGSLLWQATAARDRF